MDDSRVGPKVDIAFRKATKKFHSKGQTEEEGEDAREEPEQTIHEFDDRDDDKTDEFGVDPTQKGRGPKSERRHKRRPDMKIIRSTARGGIIERKIPRGHEGNAPDWAQCFTLRPPIRSR